MRAATIQPDRRTVTALAAVGGAVFLAGVLVVGLEHPVPVLGTLFVAGIALAVMRYPVAALIILLFLQPFHIAITIALGNKAGLALGPISYWKDALILTLFARAIVARFQADRRPRLPRDGGDRFLIVYVIACAATAALSPPRPSVPLALGRYVEGPLLLLAIRFLRPTRKQLWMCAGAILAAASVMGAAALIERFGPHERFLTWYGAPVPEPNSSFFVGEQGYRAGSFLNSPLILAFYLAGATPFAAALASRRSRWRTAALASLVLCGGGLVVTVTRSGYIGGGLGGLLALWLAIRNPRLRVAVVGIAVVSASTIALAYAAAGSETLLRSEGTESHREALLTDLRIVERQPLGYGLGTTDALQQRFNLENVPGTTESTYMARAIEAGVQGLVLYLVALFVTGMRVRSARRRALRAGDGAAAALSAGAIGAMVGIAFSGLFLGINELVVEVVLWGAPGLALAYPISSPAPRTG